MSFFGVKYVPEFSVDYDKLPWYERDFITYIDWLKYKEMKDNPDDYCKKRKSWILTLLTTSEGATFLQSHTRNIKQLYPKI